MTTNNDNNDNNNCDNSLIATTLKMKHNNYDNIIDSKVVIYYIVTLSTEANPRAYMRQFEPHCSLYPTHIYSFDVCL